ncbi:hypothetical protein BGX30_013833 [Mortierella sp. GBA39]|nr:hypothetical protein BGX30_013833 [Mortierella sp. GBA39]
MLSSFQRVFDIPELVDMLMSQLDKAEVSVLTRTNKAIRTSCLPSFYKFLGDRPGHNTKIFSSVPGTLALARNIRHVKDVTFGPRELAYYFNSVCDFEEIQGQVGIAPVSRPTWCPPPDPRTCQIVALPPLTWLSRFTLDSHSMLYNMPSPANHRTTLAQLSWLMSLNPRLVCLNLDFIHIKDLRDCRRLVEAVAGLHMIVELNLWIHCRRRDSHQLGLDLFFSVSPSIKTIYLRLQGDDSTWDLETSDMGGGGNLMVVPRRQEPLINLETFTLWDIDGQVPASDMISVFAHCPNLVQLSTGDFNNHHAVQAVADFVGRECPRIRKLCGVWHYNNGNLLPFRIMEGLPAHQITELNIDNMHSDLISAAVIFENCVNLETLKAFDADEGLYIDLEDVQGSPWRCTKLRDLTICISGCKLPINPDPESQPYYSRPDPITLSETEVQHFARLERFYLQIGRLTQLRLLHLQMVKIIEQGRALFDGVSFPALMTLGDVGKDRPGYLNHLAGLKRLECLVGSFGVDVEETDATKERIKDAWMSEHWPRFRFTQIYNPRDYTSSAHEWLMNGHMEDEQ